MISNIGPIAIGVLVLLSDCQPVLVDGDPGQDGDLQQGDRAEPEVHPSFPQGDAAAGDCRAGRRLHAQARWRRYLKTSTRPTSGRRAGRVRRAILRRWSARRRPRPAKPSPSLERRMTWLATIGSTSPFVGLFGTVMGVVDAFQGIATAGAASLNAVASGHRRGADHYRRGIVCGRAGSGCIQPVHRAHQGVCLGDGRLLPRTAEFARRDSGSICVAWAAGSSR